MSKSVTIAINLKVNGKMLINVYDQTTQSNYLLLLMLIKFYKWEQTKKP